MTTEGAAPTRHSPKLARFAADGAVYRNQNI